MCEGPEYSPRLPALDAARSLATFLVVVGHALLSFMQTPIGWAIRDRSRHIAADLVVWVGHAFLMPTFFLLAGLLACRTVVRVGLVGFARERLQRVLVPLVVLLVPLSIAMNSLWDWGRELTRREAAAVQLPILRSSEFPVTLSHLWFLYYLLIISVGVVPLVAAWRRVPLRWQARAREQAHRLAGSPWLLVSLSLLMALPTAVILGHAGKLQLDTPLSFAVDTGIAGFYGLFFLVGWLLHGHTEKLHAPGRWAALCLALALGALLLLIPVLVHSAAQTTAARPPILALFASAAFTWLTTVGFLGLCFQHASLPRPWIRFVAEASFFCYVAHLPLVVLLQIAACRLDVPGPLKLTFILVTALVVCLLGYRYLIRGTFLGRYLA